MRTRVWMFAALCLASCGDEDPDVEGETGANAMPVFESDVLPIFERSCGSGLADCHRREAYNANVNADCRSWLSLEDAPLGSVFTAGGNVGQPTQCPDLGLWDRLLMDAWMCGPPIAGDEPNVAYVVPCDPDNSLLYRSMVGPLCANMENLMPKGGIADPMEVETIRRWIENGAPRQDDPGTACGP